MLPVVAHNVAFSTVAIVCFVVDTTAITYVRCFFRTFVPALPIETNSRTLALVITRATMLCIAVDIQALVVTKGLFTGTFTLTKSTNLTAATGVVARPTVAIVFRKVCAAPRTNSPWAIAFAPLFLTEVTRLALLIYLALRG